MKQPKLPKLATKLERLSPQERKELRREAFALLTHRRFRSREWYRLPPKAGHKPDHYLVARRVGLKTAFRIAEYYTDFKDHTHRQRHQVLDKKIYSMAEVIERFCQFDLQMKELGKYCVRDAVQRSAKGPDPRSSISPYPGP